MLLKSYIYTPKLQIQSIWTKEREMKARTLPLDVWKKNEKSKVFFVCLGENLGGKKEREMLKKNAQNAQNSFVLVLRVWEVLYIFLWSFSFQHALSVHGTHMLTSAVLASSLAFWSKLWLIIWRSFLALIDLILVSMEIYGCLVFRTLDILKIQWLDRKLWHRDVS